jgi:predicted DNA-binding protein
LTANNLTRVSVRALQTPEARAKAKTALTGRTKTYAHRQALVEAFKTRRSPTLEERAKMSAARSARPNTPAIRAKISAALRGRPKPYMAAENKSRVWTDEMRAKISRARKRTAMPRLRINLIAEVSP